MSDQSDDGSAPEVCAKCGQEIDGDWDDDHPEPLCYGCSHGQEGMP